MSSDQPLAHRLGDDYQAVVRVSGAADRDQEIYPLLAETLELDLSGLSADDKERSGGRRESGHRPGLHRRAHAEVRAPRSPSRSPVSNPESDPDVRLTAWVHGNVQGVGFRWWTRCRALEQGLTGYAANQADGRVLVVAQGPREAGEKLLQLLEGGSTAGPRRQGRRRLVAADGAVRADSSSADSANLSDCVAPVTSVSVCRTTAAFRARRHPRRSLARSI